MTFALFTQFVNTEVQVVYPTTPADLLVVVIATLFVHPVTVRDAPASLLYARPIIPPAESLALIEPVAVTFSTTTAPPLV